MNKKNLVLIIFIIAVMLISGCSKNGSSAINISDKSSDVMLSIAGAKAKTYENSRNIQMEFNLNLLKEMSKQNNNLFYSSFSINQALTMAYFGANNATQEEIQNVLGYSNLTIEDVAAYQKYLLEEYKDSGDTTFYSSNSMWIDDELVVKDGYINTMFKNFDSEIQNIDLQDSRTIKKVNSWIEKSTNGMIKKLSDKPYADGTRLVLLNAIYFNGSWTNPFDESMTGKRDFNGQNKVSSADMMYSYKDILGFENDDYKAICMPYGDDRRFNMVAVLPNSDITEFIQNQTVQSLSSILTTFEEKEEPTIMFPKFEMEEKILLNDTLKALGMPTAFSESADFSEISDTPLFISTVNHKAKIKVDEEGTEAAAVTEIAMAECAMEIEEYFEFIADKPFLFFIVDSKENTVLFTGAVYDF